MKYNVGDKVRVRDDLVIGKKYGGRKVTREMSHYAGQTVTIRYHSEVPDYYDIEEDGAQGVWAEEMFEPAAEHAKREMKYKVGDKVRVRKDLVVGKEYGGLGTLFCSEMKRWRGKTVTIAEVDENLLMYIIKEDKQFSWVDEMFEPAPRDWDWVGEMLEPAPREIRIIIDGNKTSAIEGKYKGIARCSPEDKFDTVEGVRLAVERLEESKAWPRVGDDCYEVIFGGRIGKFKPFSGTVSSLDIPNKISRLVFRTKEDAQKMADKLNAVLEEDQ